MTRPHGTRPESADGSGWLRSMTFRPSSTRTRLPVTWRAFPVRALEDPKGAFGKPEGLHSLARDGFSEDFPEVADVIKNFKLTDEQYGRRSPRTRRRWWRDTRPP
ncbi:glycine betaine ABC transporter substrate-binding protein [Streptomyces sp. NPDC096132]|uniref:glycine betaine ABC transporter substrate-binding protein n=1 Tax=Streptomyces sp. NPDC096132 TaxID=3366075 RepID=UPI003826FEFA